LKLDDVLFFFLRHGETAGNVKNIYRGWSNAPEAQLDSKGKQTAREAGRYLLSIGAPIELVIADSLDRVQETVELMMESFPNARPEFVRALHPLHMGDWTLKSKDKHPVQPFLDDPSKQIPGGDTVKGFNDRQWDIFKKVFELAKDFPLGRLLVSGHGSNVAFLNNHVFTKDAGQKIGYEGLVDPGGIIAVTPSGLVPLTRVRGKGKKEEPLVQIKRFEYPPDDELGVEVPEGGSSCKSCKFLGEDEKTCLNKNFIAWKGPNKSAGSDKIPLSYDRYCSIWWEVAKGELK